MVVKSGDTLRPVLFRNKSTRKWTFVELKGEDKLSKIPRGWEDVTKTSVLFNYTFVNPEETGIEISKLPTAA